ncbi:ABC transporter integral membrane type 1 [Penicillium fimorum]|uniref:ABC transporter integral membrane type 1 n=1 Tax=Penicillium fimorum TaxID=1882269 RepID=A0A9W9XVH7_9EURO|nr:ABC transporter integral membrane type 1 [Penicillium fimorum]
MDTNTSLRHVARNGENSLKPIGKSDKVTGRLIYWTTLKGARNNGDNDYHRHIVLKHLSFKVQSSSINFVVDLVVCGKATWLPAVLEGVSNYDGRLEVSVHLTFGISSKNAVVKLGWSRECASYMVGREVAD